MTSLRLSGSVFTEPLPRSGLHNLVVPLLVRVLLRNSCYCGSTVLAWSKYVTIRYAVYDMLYASECNTLSMLYRTYRPIKVTNILKYVWTLILSYMKNLCRK
jgi:hypothetical protein